MKAVKGPPWFSSRGQPLARAHKQTEEGDQNERSLLDCGVALVATFEILLLRNIYTQQVYTCQTDNRNLKEFVCACVFFLPNKSIAPLRFCLWLPLVSSSIRRSMRLP